MAPWISTPSNPAACAFSAPMRNASTIAGISFSSRARGVGNGRCGRSRLTWPSGRDRAGGDRQLAVQERRVRNPAHVPELKEDPAAGRMDGLRDQLPAIDLLRRPDARRVRIADAHRCHRRGLRHDQPRRRTLRVVLGHERIGYPSRAGTAPRQRRHDYPIRQMEIADRDRVKKAWHRAFSPIQSTWKSVKAATETRPGEPFAGIAQNHR